MKKADLIDLLVEDHHEDRKELEKMKKDELEELLDELTDTSDMFPNGDQFDGSHEYD